MWRAKVFEDTTSEESDNEEEVKAPKKKRPRRPTSKELKVPHCYQTSRLLVPIFFDDAKVLHKLAAVAFPSFAYRSSTDHAGFTLRAISVGALSPHA